MTQFKGDGAPKFGDAAGAAVGTAVAGPVGTVVGGILPLGGIFHSSAAGPNKTAAAQVWPEVQKGNLAAVAAYQTRNNIETQTSKAPWAAGLAQIPQWLQDAASQRFPGNQWATFGAIDPTQVLSVVQRLAVYASQPTSGGAPVISATPGTTGPAAAGILGGGSSSTMILAAAGAGIAYLIFGGKKRRR